MRTYLNDDNILQRKSDQNQAIQQQQNNKLVKFYCNLEGLDFDAIEKQKKIEIAAQKQEFIKKQLEDYQTRKQAENDQIAKLKLSDELPDEYNVIKKGDETIKVKKAKIQFQVLNEEKYWEEQTVINALKRDDIFLQKQNKQKKKEEKKVKQKEEQQQKQEKQIEEQEIYPKKDQVFNNKSSFLRTQEPVEVENQKLTDKEKKQMDYFFNKKKPQQRNVYKGSGFVKEDLQKEENLKKVKEIEKQKENLAVQNKLQKNILIQQKAQEMQEILTNVQELKPQEIQENAIKLKENEVKPNENLQENPQKPEQNQQEIKRQKQPKNKTSQLPEINEEPEFSQNVNDYIEFEQMQLNNQKVQTKIETKITKILQKKKQSKSKILIDEYKQVQTAAEYMQSQLKKTTQQNFKSFNPNRPRQYKDKFKGSILNNKYNYTKNGKFKGQKKLNIQKKLAKQEEKQFAEEFEEDIQVNLPFNVQLDFKAIQTMNKKLQNDEKAKEMQETTNKAKHIQAPTRLGQKFEKGISMWQQSISTGLQFDLELIDFNLDFEEQKEVLELNNQHNIRFMKKLFNKVEKNEIIQEQVQLERLTTDYSRQNLEQILLKNWGKGFAKFRDRQYLSIKNVLEGKHSLCILSTGYGKSLIYQFPTLVMQGLTIVISPLLSLMMDQVQKLPKCLPGACFSSLLKYNEKKKMIEYVKNGLIKILYISPETLQTDLVYHFPEFPKINFIAIDEAHCISEWSHNFRTSYLVIEQLINQYFHHPTILLTTATSTMQTTKSIQEKIAISDDSVFKSDTVVRENLKLSVSVVNSHIEKTQQLMFLLNSPQFKFLNSIIIYCKYVAETFRLTEFLNTQGIASRAFNSRLEDWQKQVIQREFMNNEIKIICCTVSFAMGIDKSNVRAVIHYSMPKTIENYVQEVGRAGRDGQDAFCHLFINDQDYLKERSWVFGEQIDESQILYLRDLIVMQYTQINQKRKLVEVDEEVNILDDFEINGQYKCINITDENRNLDMKKEQITTVMLEIQKHLKSIKIIVLPECAQKITLKFYKQNHDFDQMSEKHDIIRQLIDISYYASQANSFTFQMIDACNLLKKDPIKVISELKKLASDGLGYELKNDILPFYIVCESELKQSEIIAEFDKIKEHLIKNLDLHTETLFRKIDVMFLTAKQCAYPNVKAMQNADIRQRLNKMNMNKYFDKYFSVEGNDYLEIFDEQEKIDNIDIYLPFKEIDDNIRENICFDTQQFLTEQECIMKPKSFEKLRNSKIVTRIFQGIASKSYTREEWSVYRQFWEKYYLYKYEEVCQMVEDSCRRFFREKQIKKQIQKNKEMQRLVEKEQSQKIRKIEEEIQE